MVILPDVAPENAVKASLKADEMPPEFSFGYESDKKKDEKQESTASNSNSDKATTEQQSSGSTAASSLTQGSGVNAVETETTETTETAAATATAASPASPQDPPRRTHIASPEPPTSPQQMRTPSSQPVSPTHTMTQPLTQPLTQPRPAANSNSPIWLDALILGFGGLLVAMVIRRFL